MPEALAETPTEFLPVERASQETLTRQQTLLRGQAQLGLLADAIPHALAVINAERQLVHLNATGCHMLGIGDVAELDGARPGEALGCEAAARAPGGCGTDRQCRDCGAIRSVLDARRSGTGHRNSIISVGPGRPPLELDVASRVVELGGETFVVITLTDVQHERRRRELERLFFHDLMNTAGGLLGLSEANAAGLATSGAPPAEFADLLVRGCHQLVEEIQAQRDLAAAEAGELSVRVATLEVADLVADVVQSYGHHPCADGRRLAIAPGPPVTLDSDRTLIARVLGNLVKNALEAVPAGATVTVGHEVRDGGVVLRVSNPGAVAQDVRPHLFTRKASTKGEGRGLGTYSVRLLTEGYLGGQVSWTSDERDGTTVSVTFPGLTG
jgi:signal transduction histidine kinase